MERLFTIFGAVALAGWAVIMYDVVSRDDRVPIERWIGTEVLNSPIHAGDPLLVRIERVKVRDDCPVASSRQAINEDGVSFAMPSAVHAGGSSESDVVEWEYPTPSTLPAGSYTLSVYLTYTCDEFVWTTQQPDARFRVIN